MGKNRFEWLMVVSQLLAQLSDRMTSLGLIWFITTQFGENWLTWYLVVGGLPHLIFAGFSGSWIQKFGALKTVVYADFFRAILFGISVFIFKETISENNLYFIISLIFISNMASAFFNPAILTLPLELEQGDRIQLLTARLTTITSLTTVIGPILGLFCFNEFGIKGLFFISFLSYLISGFCAFELTKMSLGNTSKAKVILKTEPNVETELNIETKPELRKEVIKDSIPVFKSLRRNHLITIMLAVFLFMNLFLSPLQVLMPVMAKNLFNNSFNSLAYMEVVFGIGIVLGGVLLSIFTIKRKELFWVWCLLVAFSASYLSFHYQEKLLMNLLFLFLMGLTLGLVNVLIIHLFQERPLKEDVPNIMSVTNLISTASVPFSLTMLALMQGYLTVEKLGLFSSIGLVIVVVLAYYPFSKWGKEIFK